MDYIYFGAGLVGLVLLPLPVVLIVRVTVKLWGKL